MLVSATQNEKIATPPKKKKEKKKKLCICPGYI